MKTTIKNLFVILSLLTSFSVHAENEVHYHPAEGTTTADIEHTRAWVSFFQKNLKCYNTNIKMITVSATRMLPSNYEISDTKDSTAKTENIVYSDAKYVVSKTNRRYKHNTDDSLVRLYLMDSRVVWAEQLSKCPDQEDLTISGVGIDKALQRISQVSDLPDADSYLNLLSSPTPMEYFMSIENDKNDCQVLSYMTDRFRTHGKFNPKAPKDTLDVLMSKIERMWKEEVVQINGFSSPEKMALDPETRLALKQFSESKRNGMMLKASNLKMTFNPSKKKQANLSKDIKDNLKSGLWTQLLERESGFYNSWHNITVVNGEYSDFDGDSRLVLYFYNSQAPTKLEEMTYSEREGGFFASVSGKLFTKKYLWENKNKTH